MNRERCVCVYIWIYIWILLSHKRNEILPLGTTWMDLDSIMLSEITQTEKNEYCVIDFTDMWDLRKQNKWTNIAREKNRLIDIENKQAVARAEGARGIGEIGEKK